MLANSKNQLIGHLGTCTQLTGHVAYAKIIVCAIEKNQNLIFKNQVSLLNKTQYGVEYSIYEIMCICVTLNTKRMNC